MKSWQLEKTGRENLHLVDIPEPKPGPDEILVRTTAVSLNFRDKAIIEGLYPRPLAFPLVPGGELAGEVVAVGAKVTRFKPTDKVVSVYKPLWIDGVPTLQASAANRGAPLPGVLEEYIVLSEDGTLSYPDYLTPAQASTVSIAGVTAWVALFDHGHLQPSETVLVHGTGGVSLFGLQLARAHGSRVIATSRSSRKIPSLKELGASDVIDTTIKPAWEEEARSLTCGKGIDHILEVVGGESVQRSIAAAAWGGHVAIIGYMESGSATITLASMLPLFVKLQGLSVGSRRHMSDLLMERHSIRPVIDATYDFDALQRHWIIWTADPSAK
jgi:NADPH:quinone reductase-like Zn-dependent oxidoreductase